MGMNPSRYDKWPKPRRLRHVWVKPDSDRGPAQGFVIRWEKWGGEWRAFVVFARDHDEPRTDWFSPDEMVPVRSDPDEPRATKSVFGMNSRRGRYGDDRPY